jgi:hypothetical protein
MSSPILSRTHWYVHGLDDMYRDRYSRERSPVAEKDRNKANLVGSLLPTGDHGPAIDLDFPCRLIPSRSQGHFHLYLERPVAWEKYLDILKTLHAAELINGGFYKLALKYKQTFLRFPGDYLAPTCTTSDASAQDVLELVDIVRGVVGQSPTRDLLDRKISSMEDRVYSIMAAKLDEIVARRVQRGIATAAMSGENLPEGSDRTSDPTRSNTLSRVPTPLRRHRKG